MRVFAEITNKKTLEKITIYKDSHKANFWQFETNMKDVNEIRKVLDSSFYKSKEFFTFGEIIKEGNYYFVELISHYTLDKVE